MDLASLLIILALLILVGLFIARPFLEGKSKAVSLEEHEYSALLAERDRLILALHELDFDHALQKIPADEYPAQRAVLLQQGADILRRIDAYLPAAAAASAEERIEAAIASRRAERIPRALPAEQAAVPAARSSSGAVALAADDELEARIAARRRSRSGKSAGFCPQCGGPLQAADRFCPKCGGKI
jgi:hypothetical protein